jgi:hypothetical protein
MLRAPKKEREANEPMPFDEVLERYGQVKCEWVEALGEEGKLTATWDIEVDEDLRLDGFKIWFLRRVMVPHENPLKPDKEEWVEDLSTTIPGKRRRYVLRNLPPACEYRVEVKPFCRALKNFSWHDVFGQSKVSEPASTERRLEEEWATVFVGDGSYVFYNVNTRAQIEKTTRRGGRKWHAFVRAPPDGVSLSLGYFRNELDAAAACLEKCQYLQKIASRAKAIQMKSFYN